MPVPNYSNVFLDDDKPRFDPLNPPGYDDAFVGPIPIEEEEKEPPLSLAGTIPEENTYANSDAFREVLEKALAGGVESLTDAERKQVKMAREQFPDVDAVFAEAERRAQAESQDPEQALLQRIAERLQSSGSLLGDVRRGVEFPHKTAVDVVATVGQTITQALREEAGRTPGPVSPFRDTNENPLTPEEIQAQQEWSQLGTADKILAMGRRLGFGAVAGGLEFMTQSLDPIVNPQKYGTTSHEAILEIAEGLVNMIAEAPDQVAYLAELAGAPDVVTKFVEGIGTALQAGELVFGEATREELKQQAVNHLYENPESLPFVFLIVKGAHVKMTKMAKPKLGPESDYMIIKRSEVEQVGEQIVKEKADAAQKPKAEKVPVQKEADGGKEVGKAPEKVPKEEVAPPEGLEAPRPVEPSEFKAFDINRDMAHHKEAIERNKAFIEEEGATKTAEELGSLEKYQKRLEGELVTLEGRLEKIHEPPKSVVKPPETLKLSKEEHSAVLQQLDLEALPEVQRRAHIKQFEKAKERGYDQEAFDLADRVIDAGEPLTAAHRAGLFLKTGELKKEYDASTKLIQDLEAKGDRQGAEFELLRRDEIKERIGRLSEAFDKSGTEAGRAGALAQVTLNLETWDIESVHARGTESAGRVLTRVEEQVLEAGVERIATATEQVEALRTELRPEVEAAQQKINQEFYADPKVQKRARKRTESLINGLEKRGEILEGLETSADAVFGEKGKRYPKDINLKDIKALEKHLSDLKFNAYSSVPTSTGLESVFKRIDLLKDHLANLRILAKKGERLPLLDLSKARTQLRQLIKDLEPTAEIRERQGQLKSGDIEIVERPPTANLPPKLENAEIELLDAKEQVRQEIFSLTPISARGVIREYSNVLRTLKATTDVSYVGRQGALPSAALLMKGKAGSVPEAFMKSLQAAFKETTADKIDFRLRSEPLHYLREEAGLELTRIKDIDIYKREEAFWSNAAEKIPGYGRVVKWSNRNMVTGLNVIRARYFDWYVETYPNATKAELRAWADVVNVTSGRGNLGKLKNVASELSFGIFAPRFSSSRMETPFLIFKHGKEPRVRKEIAKDMARSTALAGSVLAIASLAGYEVGTNFRDSDFGKIRSGDTRIDIFAGYQQWMRFLFRSFNAAALEPAGVSIGEQTYPYKDDPLELMWNYAKYKAAPSITLPYTLITGHNVVYEQQGRLEALGRGVAPMVSEDIVEAALAAKGDVALSALSPLGVGVATYGDSETKVRRQIANLRFGEEKDEEAAQALQDDWNEQNPEKQIKQVTDPNKEPRVEQADVDLTTLRVNPNTAPADSLEMLPKIGEVNAQRIIEWRKTHEINTVEDLDSIPGIGPKTIEILRPYIHLLKKKVENK